MKVIDQSPVSADIQPFDKFKVYFRGVSKFGWNWIADVKAEETIIESLKKFFDNTYTIIRNVVLEGIDIPIPLVLVGPPGIYVLLASGASGVFRAKGDVWMEMVRRSGRSRKYASVRKNLIARAQLMTRVVDAYLSFHQRPHPPIQTALLFADAGAHVDSSRSAVRVVLKDGMEHFANSVIQEQATLKEREEIQKIVDALTGKLPEGSETFMQPAPVEASKPGPFDKVTKATKSLRPRQWMLLGVMAFFEALILIAIFIIVITNLG